MYNKIQTNTEPPQTMGSTLHGKEEPKTDNSDMTFRTQQKYSNLPSLPQRHDCKTIKYIKYCNTKQRLNTNPHKQWMEQQWTNNSRATALDQTAAKATVGVVEI